MIGKQMANKNSPVLGDKKNQKGKAMIHEMEKESISFLKAFLLKKNEIKKIKVRAQKILP